MRTVLAVKLGDVTTSIMGQAPPGHACNKNGEGTIFVKAGEFSDRTPLIREWTTKPLKFAKSGDVLVCVVGATAGKINLAIDCAIGRSVAAVRPNPRRLDTGYLHHFLSIKVQELRDRSQGLAQGVITREMLAEVDIPLPPLDEQRRIAAILDKADALRRKRRHARELLDGLTQSTFLEMFGDPGSNPRAWANVNLGDVIHKASDGPHVSPEYSESGIPFLSTRHIKKSGVIWEDLKYIDPLQAEIHWKKCRPECGDILYTKGGTTGIAAVVETSRPFAVWVHVALLKLDKLKVEPLWLECMLNSEFCYQQSQTLTHGIANRDLGLKRMVKINFYLPPKSEQRRFCDVIQRLRAVRQSHERAESSSETLFLSLQHRAFSGQL